MGCSGLEVQGLGFRLRGVGFEGFGLESGFVYRSVFTSRVWGPDLRHPIVATGIWRLQRASEAS